MITENQMEAVTIGVSVSCRYYGAFCCEDSVQSGNRQSYANRPELI